MNDRPAEPYTVHYLGTGHVRKRTRHYDISGRADEELVRIASMWENAMYGDDEPMGRPAAEYGWEVVDFPIDQIASKPDDWSAWMAEEVENWVQDGDPDRYTDILTEDIREEVVLVLHEDENGVVGGYLWDGYHRTAATVVKGGTTIKAVVGTMLPEYVQEPMSPSMR